MDNEKWMEIPHYFGNYYISNMGRVWSKCSQRILKPRYDKDGYIKVALYCCGKPKYEYVHRLVALCFCEKPEGATIVNHKNEIKNDNRAENLEWCDKKYNNNYGTRNKRISESHKALWQKYKNLNNKGVD